MTGGTGIVLRHSGWQVSDFLGELRSLIGAGKTVRHYSHGLLPRTPLPDGLGSDSLTEPRASASGEPLIGALLICRIEPPRVHEVSDIFERLAESLP